MDEIRATSYRESGIRNQRSPHQICKSPFPNIRGIYESCGFSVVHHPFSEALSSLSLSPPLNLYNQMHLEVDNHPGKTLGSVCLRCMPGWQISFELANPKSPADMALAEGLAGQDATPIKLKLWVRKKTGLELFCLQISPSW